MTRPTIVTSSWYTQLPTADLITSATESYCRIGISRGTPRGQSGFRMYRRLQPAQGTLKLPDAEFTKRYLRDVLGRLDAHQVVRELLDLADGNIAVLCCFEHTHSPAWCHRGIVSAWLQAEIGIGVPEYGREQDGCGVNHPKLCAEARALLSRRGTAQ
jgi:hypothetical protein